MEVGEMDRKEPQVEVPWIPTTPIKPVSLKPVPIYTPGERNHMGHHANGAVACVEFSLGNEKICGSGDGSNVAADSGKTCEQTATDAVSSYSKLGFCEHLFAVEAESRNSSVIQGNNDRLKNSFVPSFIFDNAQSPQETYNANNEESRQIASVQINMEEKDPGGEERNVPANKLDNNVPPNSKELCDPVIEFAAVSSPLKENHNLDKGSSHDTDLNKTPQQNPRRRKHRPKVIKEDKPKRTRKPIIPKPAPSKENPTVKRKYVRRKGLNQTSPTEVIRELTKEMPGSAKMSCRRSLNFDIGTRDESSAAIENTTALLGKENGVLVQETNISLAFDLNTSMKQASNCYMSLPEDAQAPNTSPSRRKISGTKPEENPTARRKYVRRKGVNKTSDPPTEVTGKLTKEKMPESAQMSCTGSLNFDERARDQSYAVKENTMAHPGSEIGVVMQEMNVGLAYDLNTSMKQASNSYMSLPEDTKAPNTSSRRKSSGTKPEENPTGKRKYVRKKEVNKTSPTEVTGELTKENMPESAQMSCTGSVNFDERARDQSYAVIGNPTVHPGSEVGVVMQKMNAGLAYDLNTPMKQASNNYMSLPEDAQAPNKSPSRRKSSGTKPEENPTGKKYLRKKGVKTSAPPIEVPGELTKEKMPASAQTSCTGSINFDERAKDQGYAVKENPTVHPGSEIGVVMQEMNVGLAYDLNTSMKQALNDDVTLPKDAPQAPSTSSKMNLTGTKTKENLTGKRQNDRKKGLNLSPIPPAEMTELTEAMILESNNMSWRRSLNFDMGTRDGSYVGRENLDLHIGKENMVLEETKVGLTYNQDIWMKGALNNCKSLLEETQHPSTSISKSNPLGAKLNANSVENKNKKGQPTTQDGNISNSQSSTIRLQMVGSKRKHSGTFNCADDSSMNLIGAHYNGLPSYQTNFCIQFPNIQKKRRTEKGKTSNTYVTSVTTTKEVQHTYPQEDALAHPYASSSSSWMYGSSGYNAAGVPAISELTEHFIDNNQTFDEFVLSLKRLAERSQSSTCDHGSLTRIRNCDTQPNYTAKQVRVSSRETFEDAERPQTCIDALITETRASPTKKKRNRKKSVLSSSAHSSTNPMLQHHNFILGNYPLPMGKLSDIAPEVLWKTMNNIDLLTEQFRRLNINTEARDLAFHEQNALVPYKQQKQNSLGDGVIIPFHIKKQHPRPKVDLDDETDRVWKLLMLDINSHGIDGTNEDKAKWWEEERNVFRGRADSFIARMHLVQGDRRFSRWKGSVVDSVVGVFLTQNVSDHLSSSAFMSLAARFPKKSSGMCKTHHAEDTRLVVNEPQVHIVEPEDSPEWDVKLLNQSVYDQSSLTIDIAEYSGEKAAINSNDSCGTTSSVISLTDESNSRLSELSQRNTKEHYSPMRSGHSATIEEREEKSCYDGDRKEVNDIVSSQGSVISSQISGDFSNDQNPEKIGSCSDSNSEVEDLSGTAKYNHFDGSTSFSKLLEMVSSTKFYEDNSQKNKSIENLRDAYDQPIHTQHNNPKESLKISNVTQGSSEASIIQSHEYTLKLAPPSGVLEVNCFDPFKTEASSSDFLKKKDENGMNRSSFQTTEPAGQVAITHSQSIVSHVHPQEQSNHLQQSFFNVSGQTQDLMQKERGSDLVEHKNAMRNETNKISSAPIKLKSREQGKEKKDDFNWDSLRIEAQAKAGKREKTENTMDSLDWDAVRCAHVSEIAETIKERGMNNRLAERIKNFLNRLVEEHGSIDLEWLRDVPPDKAKEYLLSIRGLGLKSVECVRLLTLHHLAFPVDTNVGRIAVRLGWVPLQPLPESLQLHLLELYPVLESIQKYLWPRLCKLDQKTLYELHYQLITFGKVFCTKSKPNCNACPMRGECRHFASAFASARLALPGPEQKSMVSTTGNSLIDQNQFEIISQLHLPPPENTTQAEEIQLTEVSRQLESKSKLNICQPIIEEPTTPEPECSQVSQTDIEDAFYEDSCEIPTIKLNIEEFTLNLQNYMQENMELQEGEMSKALVALNPEAASIPMPKLKNVSRLRTEHCVYELPDTHPLLQGWDTREPDDPGKYLLAIWTPGETANSIQPPESKCSSQEECGQLCNEKECFSCNSFREANSQIVRGTILV
ncbi:ROS1 protein [Spatholobus suberectus]|nr:ROS1 protein [Spatholobus suberectus]